MLFFVLLISASAVLQIEECGCTSADSASGRENLWQCSVSAPGAASDHFSSSAQAAYANKNFATKNYSLNKNFALSKNFALKNFALKNFALSKNFASLKNYSIKNYSLKNNYANAANNYATRNFATRNNYATHNFATRNNYATHNFASGKRSADQVCSCFSSVQACLQSSSCSATTTALDSLCNWNSGRLFGSCTPCSGQVEASDGLATASDLMTRLQEFEPSISAALVQLVPQITAISFSPRDTSSLVADVTVASGVVAVDEAYNQVIYQLSHIFDVYPGTFQWDTVSASGKRQSANQIVINFYDEQLPSSGVAVFVPVLIASLFVCLFGLL